MKKEDVSDVVVDKLVAAGVTTTRQFAVLVANPDELRTLAAAELGIDPKDLAGKVKMSHLLCAFNAAKARAAEADKVDAENITRNLPKVMPVNDYNAMRKTFEDKYWKLDDGKAPCQSYIEDQLANLEKGDFGQKS